MAHNQRVGRSGHSGHSNDLKHQKHPPTCGIRYGHNFGHPTMAMSLHQPGHPPMDPRCFSHLRGPKLNMQPGSRASLMPAPNTNPRAQNAQIQPKHMVQYGNTVYIVSSILQQQNNDPRRMSNGVRILTESITGNEVIEKNLMTVSEIQRARATTEVNCLKQIRDAGGSPHLNAMYDAFRTSDGTSCVILLEYCDTLTLDEHISKTLEQMGRITESLCWHILAGMTAALTMLHYGIRNPDAGTQYQPNEWNTICHLDIKPANVFTSRRMQPGQETWQSRVVLGDFGCAVTKQEMNEGRHNPDRLSAGTPGWTAPEIGTNAAGKWVGPYGKPTDVWQMGGLIQCLCRLVLEPNQDKANSRRPCGSVYSKELNKAITSAMTKEMLNRPTALDMWVEIKKLNEKWARG